MTKITEEIKNLFYRVRIELGAPVRTIHIDDETLCGLLSNCVSDYAERVQNWLVENQWMNLYGKNISNTDMAYALSVRSFDMAKDYSYYFSKEVGLQQRGPWELKKDFIEIEPGKQVYIIPEGREINSVMWMNPPTTQASLFANYAGIDVGFGGGYAQMGGGGTSGPIGGYYVMPAADIAYLATDMTYKQRLLKSDLVYKITAGPNGTRLLHLLSTPGSTMSFNYAGVNGGGLGLVGCTVWYTYYDVNSKEEADNCRRENEDVILTPDQVPLSQIDYTYLNEPTKALIRQLLTAKAKIVEGNIRGTFSGKVNIPQAEMTMDYQMLHSQGEKEWDKTMEKLDQRLERMSAANVMKTQAELAENLNKVNQYIPMGIYTI
jgi:hypothetical protein